MEGLGDDVSTGPPRGRPGLGVGGRSVSGPGKDLRSLHREEGIGTWSGPTTSPCSSGQYESPDKRGAPDTKVLVKPLKEHLPRVCQRPRNQGRTVGVGLLSHG